MIQRTANRSGRKGPSHIGSVRHSLFQVFRQHQFRSATAQHVVYAIKRITNDVQPESARLDQIGSPTLQRIGSRLFPVVAQPQADAITFHLERERNKLVIAQMVSVTNDVGAGLIYAKDHESPLTFGEGERLEKTPHTGAEQGEITGVTG